MKRFSIFLPLVILLASCELVLSSNILLSSSSSESSSASVPTSPLPPNINIDLYNLNDFHGAVEHNSSNKE